MRFPSPRGGPSVIYMVSPSKFVAVPLNDPNPVIWDFKQPPAPPTISRSSLSLNPTSITGGNSSTGTVTLSGPAPAGGVQVALSSSNAAAASVPSSVTVAAGATSAIFTVSTTAVASQTAVTISATYSGVIKSASLTVKPAPPPPVTLASLTLNPSSVVGGVGCSTGTVTLRGPAPPGGA